MRDQLTAFGLSVFVPKFPTPEDQSLESWRAVFRETVGDLDPAQTVLIGHSTGAPFILRMAEETSVPYKALFPICPFAEPLHLDFDPLNETFAVTPPFDWARVRRGASYVHCFASDNDPYVPLAASQRIAEALSCPLTLVPGGQHLNAEAGMLSFPLLLDTVKPFLESSCR